MTGRLMRVLLYVYEFMRNEGAGVKCAFKLSIMSSGGALPL